MEDKSEKSEQIVKSIKLLEGVLKTTPNKAQRARVMDDINKLRKMLQELYPDANLRELENAIYSNLMVIPSKREKSIKDYECLKDIEIQVISPYKEDMEINEVSSIMKYFEERMWGVLSDQHTKLVFSSCTERDSLYRKLDQCDRILKAFCQTIEDIESTTSNEYLKQLQVMRMRYGRLFLFEIYDFFKNAKTFISDLLSDSQLGGNMILNPDDKIEYADYEKHKTFDGFLILDTLEIMKKFANEALDFINVPEIK